MNRMIEIDPQLESVYRLIAQKAYQTAILILTEMRLTIERDIENRYDDYLTVLDLLSSLYSVEGEHRKAADISCKMLSILFEKHNQKYGNILTAENLDFDEVTLNKIISLHLGIGASLSRLCEFQDAKHNLEVGYFISYVTYGDTDERTLKLNYNLAVNEMQGIDQQEGIRQLKFVYKDMVQYLGADNMHTKKAGALLEMIEKKN